MSKIKTMPTSSDVRRLKGEIDAKKKFIASLPSENHPLRANHQKTLGEKEMEYEMALEAQRRESVFRAYEEMNPPITEECPICLETIKIYQGGKSGSWCHALCCGGGCCVDCFGESRRRGDIITKCPLCREDYPRQSEQDKVMKLSKQRAEDGRSWAQAQMGMRYLMGRDGFPVNSAKALKWSKLSADQGDPDGMYCLAEVYAERGGESSLAKARSLMEEAADLGSYQAQMRFGEMCSSGDDGPMDFTKAAKYLTLAYHQEPNPRIAFVLGSMFSSGRGLTKSLYRAKYYLQEALDKDDESLDKTCIYIPLAMTLSDLYGYQYEGTACSGHDCTPLIISYLRKAAIGGDTRAHGPLSILEGHKQQKCHNCCEKAAGKLKRCTRCKSVWYCDKTCQLEDWKAGHKIDCVEQVYYEIPK